jgi:ABC-2 type transport system ATP-binding protein
MTEDRMIFISTHQIRDLDNLIDRVIIVDEGDLLLDASLDEIGERLVFKNVDDVPAEQEILYEENSLRGKAIVVENILKEASKINLEQLFNTITDNPVRAKEIFKTQVVKYE